MSIKSTLGLVVALAAGAAAAGVAHTITGPAVGVLVHTPPPPHAPAPLAGVPVASADATVAPNPQRSLSGGGYVVLNEQIPTGDGVTSSGMTVNMIHVYLQSISGGIVDPLTGQLVGGTATTTGEIIVGSATTSVGG